MAPGAGRIGLNEILLGLPFPASALEIARHAVPAASLDSVLYGGALCEADEALARGLVDGVAQVSLMAEARDVACRLGERPAAAFRTIKAALKAPALDRARETLEPLRAAFVDAWYAPEARRRIAEVRARLVGSAPSPVRGEGE